MLHGNRADEWQFIIRVPPIAGGIQNSRRNEDHQVFLVAAAGFTSEKSTENGQVSQDRDFVLNLRNIFAEQSTQHDRLAVPYNGAGGNLAQPEVRQGQQRCEWNAARAAADRLGLRIKAAGIVIA